MKKKEKPRDDFPKRAAKDLMNQINENLVRARDSARKEAEATSINHPDHYNKGQIEVIEAIEDWVLGFHEGNAVKYIARAQAKGDEIENLKKAVWYLERRIKLLEAPTCAECGVKMAIVFHTTWRCQNCGATPGAS